MQRAPERIFILENGKYIEIDYQRFELLMNQQSERNKRYFIPLHGMLMEVEERDYQEFYKIERRQRYLREESRTIGEISCNMLATDEFKGKEIIANLGKDVVQEVENKIMLDDLSSAMNLLTDEERELLRELYFEERTEREIAKQKNVSQVAIHKRKIRVLDKIKRFLEKN